MTQKLDREPIDISIAIAETVTDCPEDVCPECINKIMEIARRKLENNHLSIVEIAKRKLDTKRDVALRAKKGNTIEATHITAQDLSLNEI